VKQYTVLLWIKDIQYWINDAECVTLGHDFKEHIVRHAYLRILDVQVLLKYNRNGSCEINEWVLLIVFDKHRTVRLSPMNKKINKT